MGTVKITDEMAEEALRSIDWKVVDATTDEEIARQVADNPDAAPLLSDEEMDRGAYGSRIRSVRKGMGLSQEAFAVRFGFPVSSLRDWEQGRRAPDSATKAYLTVIEREPDAVIRALGSKAA